jgi:GNAT superfamily N-acetyltransferase
VTLRDAVPSDADSMTAVFLAARRMAMPWLPALHTDARTRDWLAGIVLRDCRVRVAEAERAVTGFAAIQDGWLHHLYVAPAHQRTGIGSRLLEEAKAIAGASLELHVFQRNRGARVFYQRHGFVEAAFSDGAGNEELEPDLVMRWTALP